VVAVQDDGQGMDEETRGRIFDPFFTTKGVGKGTGLGLAMAYGTVRQHGGFIAVESRPGRGTTFRLHLPLTGASLPAPAEGAGARPAPRGGSETILLAEDDAGLRRLAEQVLRTAGYRVLVACDGEEAVSLFAGHAEVDLCVLDVVMPRRSGPAAFREISALRPGTRVIFVTGWAPETVLPAELPAGADLIQKPYPPADLLERVRAVLDR
jgi:CheY-like chemotaxis protein